jgi:aryl-alcohol dehydrogenase-like predicted oxidoreductase
MKSIERSLRRLRTDYVDLLQLHSCTAAVLERTDLTQTLLEAQESGKARFIGYSGDSKDAVAAINTGVFDTLQTSINLADQEAITLTLPAAHERSMGILAKAVARKCCLEAHATAGQSVLPGVLGPLGPHRLPVFARRQLNRLIDYCSTLYPFRAGCVAAIIGSKSEERLRQTLTFVPPSRLPVDQFEYIRDLGTTVPTVLGWSGVGGRVGTLLNKPKEAPRS